MSYLKNLLLEKFVTEFHPDDPELLLTHEKVMKTKPTLRAAFNYFYDRMSELCDEHAKISGREIELGSGAGFFNEIRPSVEQSDIRTSSKHRLKIDALDMNLSQSSIRCFYAINVFHHLRDPDQFFNELHRTLKPGGICILIEPHNGLLSAWLHKRVHEDEFFDPKAPNWTNDLISGPLAGANQALAHIVFERDAELFATRYTSKLAVIHRQFCCNGLEYLASGGVNFKSLIPAFMMPVVKLTEKLLRQWRNIGHCTRLPLYRNCEIRQNPEVSTLMVHLCSPCQ